MRLLVLTLLTIMSCHMAVAQPNANLELVSNVPIGEPGNDIWGYVDADGVEYAIMGGFTATYIYSLADPANPEEKAVIPGASSTWRDIKSYRDHLYVTTDDFNQQLGEVADGLTIIDMADPDSITFTKWKPQINVNGAVGQLGECHNLYIDTVQGYCYLAGCQNVGEEGVLILDLKDDPKNPTVVGATNDRYTHDCYVLDDKLYSADIIGGILTIYDISDKTNPIELGIQSTTSFFTHNVWTSDDGQFAFTTDERPGGRVDAYDISDPANTQRLDEYRPADRFADNAIPHNTHYLDGYLVTSWYTEGLVIMDANKPDNLVKIASYDTYTDEATIPANQANRWFFGLWGAYPYLPSGLMLGSDINTGLYVWQPVQETNGSMADGFVRASYLEGTVTDANSGMTVSGAEIRIQSPQENVKATNSSGVYKTGQVLEGEFDVLFSHPNYEELTLTATMTAGEVTILDAQLTSTPLTINAVDAEGNPTPWVTVIIENILSGFRQELLIRESGSIVAPVRDGEVYKIQAARWGYNGVQRNAIGIDGAQTIELLMVEGYQDDFFLDLGWTVETTATSGGWGRGIPTNQSFDGAPTQIAADIPNDIGIRCYATGLSGTSAGDNDIDGGITTLTSRTMDWRDYTGAEVSYHLFFANVGGQGTAPNDSVYVRLSNGTETINLPGLSESTFLWTDSIISMVTPADLEFTNEMTISFTATDLPEGHISEAQLDGFNVRRLGTVSVERPLEYGNFTLYPNPTQDVLQVSRPANAKGFVSYSVYSSTGQLVQRSSTNSQLIHIDTRQWQGAGIYYLHIVDEYGGRQVEKVVKL